MGVRFIQLLISVCQECNKFLSATQTADFNDGWPVIFYRFLFKKKLQYHETKEIMKIMHPHFLSWWSHGINEMRPDVKKVIEEGNWWTFGDLSEEYHLVKDMWINKDKVFTERKLFAMLERTALKRYRCPTGCTNCVDSPDRMNLLSLKHHLACIIEGFNSYGADKKQLLGARPDWTNAVEQCGIYYHPAVVIDPDQGICILTCPSSEHRLDVAYIHVPPPSILEHGMSRTFKETPMHLTANVASQGKVHENNISFNTYTMRGNQVGLSTFNISKDVDESVPMNEEMCQMSGVICHEREDCLNLMREKFDTSLNNYSKESLDAYEGLAESVKEKVKQCKLNATFVDFEDKCARTKACFEIMHDSSKGEAVQYNSLQDCLSIVRKTYDTNSDVRRSHRPFTFDMNYKDKDEILSGILLTIMSNNRKIHRNYVTNLGKKQEKRKKYSALYNGLRTMLNSAVTQIKRKNKRKLMSTISKEITKDFIEMNRNIDLVDCEGICVDGNSDAAATTNSDASGNMDHDSEMPQRKFYL